MMEPPLPWANAAGRWYHVLLRGLVERGHRVTALASCANPGDVEKARQVFPSDQFDLRLFPHPDRSGLAAKWETLRRPFSYMFSAEMRASLGQAMAEGFDVLHLEQLWTGWLGLGHPAKAFVNVHFLYSIDLGASPAPSLREWFTRRLAWRAERRLLSAYRFLSAVSPRLLSAIREVNPRAQGTVVPIGIDVSLYPFIPEEARSTEQCITLIGSMGWYPGYSAAVRLVTRLWPSIKQKLPAARLRIVGWSARSALRAFLGQPDIEILENVPDIRPYFEQANVFLYAPSQGSGMKVKILECMAFGVPVVTTNEGIEGIPAEDGVHAGVCEDDAGLVERTIELLTDGKRQARQRRAARELLEQHCSPRATLDAVEGIYAQILGQPL